MGNYKDIEYDFIDRTIKLISQYHKNLEQYEFDEQFNFTLTINCLLGLIVMPKERVISFIPQTRLSNDFRAEIGISNSIFDSKILTLRDLVKALRNSVAHFDIKVISEDDDNLINWIEFSDSQNYGRLVAKFQSKELLPFLEYYSRCLLSNLKERRNS